eukprot:CAMPEP_0117691898 /NCGR_PEP_ID=MMETSP0804-20121206/26005_1 /TAXON_ID=1074897 /ORGANISM="Tetraselmis astigmatica, Strain CCMP880" /LENGTH=35 /DNA_ID= /DNA_START= /DNA_END= /DNA_ORIENTATION=
MMGSGEGGQHVAGGQGLEGKGSPSRVKVRKAAGNA